MIIDSVIFQTAFKNIKKQPVSDVVKAYLNDLYKLYNVNLNYDSSQFVYRYDLMGTILMNKLVKNNKFDQVDMVLLPSWGVTWNMDYSAPELYLKNKFNIHAAFLDVKGCGLLCVFYALNTLLKLYNSNSISKALCCSIENAWLFKLSKNKPVAPEINFVASLSTVSKCNSKQFVKVVLCEVISNKQYIEKIKSMINAFSMNINDFIVYVKHKDNFNVLTSWNVIFYPISSGFVYYCLDFIFKNRIKFNYIFIVDHDHALFSTGILLIKQNGFLYDKRCFISI
ncbi:MAG: hypothetical protein A3E82_09130 [Gammaproteobacteria bacterium RIFCSPHIGHO2_12_FULL_38_11]|nr:MAG: hypothetical protein A3E82_09130 [Gammaproteobacteria bacterium RIFCSPHIGHO2_12_FULL_38_11]